MTLDELKTELQSVLRDPTVESSFTTWLNQAMVELSGMYELPSLRLRKPAVLTTTTAEWLYPLTDAVHPDGFLYQKRVFRITSEAFQQGIALESEPYYFDDIDPMHTQVGDSVQRVAVQADEVATWPKAVDALNVWFYRRPLDMEEGDDEPELPEPYHYKVLVPMVVLRSFRAYPDQPDYGVQGDGTKALALWTARLNQGLWGDGISLGLLPYLNKAQRTNTPRIRGPAYGSSLGGSWHSRWW